MTTKAEIAERGARVMRGVVALRAVWGPNKRPMTYAKIGAAMNLSPERVRQAWQRHLRLEGKRCCGCRPEPLEIDMEGMTITMRWINDEDWGAVPRQDGV